MSRAGAATVSIPSPFPASVAGLLAKRDRADFAQEFLRRNPAYRAAWARFGGRISRDETAAREAARWGLAMLFDPDRPARSDPALWHHGAASQVVALVAAPQGFEGAALLPKGPLAVDENVAGVRHLVLDHGGVRHRFCLTAASRDAPVAILLPPLGDALRAAACDAARRMFAGLGLAEAAAALRPSVLQHQRLALLLRILDASQAGASNREIGIGIVYPWLAGTDAVSWKSSGERRRVQRLLSEARHLAAEGYRGLLKP